MKDIKSENFKGKLEQLDLWKNKTYLALNEKDNLQAFWKELKEEPQKAFYCSKRHESILFFLLEVDQYYEDHFIDTFLKIIHDFLTHCKNTSPELDIINWRTCNIHALIPCDDKEEIHFMPSDVSSFYFHRKKIWQYHPNENPRLLQFANEDAKKRFEREWIAPEDKRFATLEEIDLLNDVIKPYHSLYSDSGETLLDNVLLGWNNPNNRTLAGISLIQQGMKVNMRNRTRNNLWSILYTVQISEIKNKLALLESAFEYDPSFNINHLFLDKLSVLGHRMRTTQDPADHITHVIVKKYFEKIQIEDIEIYLNEYGAQHLDETEHPRTLLMWYLSHPQGLKAIDHIIKKNDLKTYMRDIHQQDGSGDTVLHYFIKMWDQNASHNHISVFLKKYQSFLKFIALCGGTLDIKNKKGDSVIDLILAKNDIILIKIFFDHFPEFFEDKLNNKVLNALYKTENLDVDAWFQILQKNTENTDILIKPIKNEHSVAENQSAPQHTPFVKERQKKKSTQSSAFLKKNHRTKKNNHTRTSNKIKKDHSKMLTTTIQTSPKPVEQSAKQLELLSSTSPETAHIELINIERHYLEPHHQIALLVPTPSFPEPLEYIVKIATFIDIPSRILKDIDACAANKGTEIFPYGGCIRDILLQKKPKDIDLIWNTDIEQVYSFLMMSGYLPKQSKHIKNLITLRSNNEHFDITCNPHFKFAATPIQMLGKRVDFTINGMVARRNKQSDVWEVCDSTRIGIEHLKEKKLHKTNGWSIFTEDPKRFWRGLLRHIKDDFELTQKFKKKIQKNLTLLFEKHANFAYYLGQLFSQPNIVTVFSLLEELGILDYAFSTLSQQMKNNTKFKRTIEISLEEMQSMKEPAPNMRFYLVRQILEGETIEKIPSSIQNKMKMQSSLALSYTMKNPIKMPIKTIFNPDAKPYQPHKNNANKLFNNQFNLK